MKKWIKLKILIDSREQKILTFKHPQITEIIIKKCEVGDYGCQFEDGFIVPVYFERKGLSDLFGTLGMGYKRYFVS